MFRRLLGLLLILRALAPFLIIGVIAVVGSVIVSDLQAALEEPVRSIDAAFRDAQTAIESAREDVETLTREVTSVVDRLRSFSLPNVIPNLPVSLTLPRIELDSLTIPIPDISVRWSNSPRITYPSSLDFSWTSGLSITWSDFSIRYPSSISISTSNYRLDLPDIPQVSIPLPGLRELGNLIRGAFSSLTGVFDVFDEAFGAISGLGESVQAVSESITAVVGEAKTALETLRDTVMRWGGVLAAAGVVLLVLAVIYFIVPSIDDFQRGWRMLRGSES